MAFVIKDRIKDTSTTTGTGAVTVSGTAPTGYKTFSAVCSTSDTFFYCIAHQTLDEWEVGVGTYSASNQVTRTTVIAGTNGASAVNFSAGTKDVFISAIASKLVTAENVGSQTDWKTNVADKLLETDVVWGAMAEYALSDSATISWDMANGFDYTVTLGGNRTLGNPTNTKVGQKGRLRVVQDGTGSRTLALSSYFFTEGGSAPTLSTGASDIDVLYYDVRSSTEIYLTLAAKDVS